MKKNKIKICGVKNNSIIDCCKKYNVNFIGFNFYKKSPRYISPSKVEQLMKNYTNQITAVGIFYNHEIEDVLQSTIPTLPTHQVPEGALPLPLTGLPDGWTMDQWVAYGHLWWEQNGP